MEPKAEGAKGYSGRAWCLIRVSVSLLFRIHQISQLPRAELNCQTKLPSKPPSQILRPPGLPSSLLPSSPTPRIFQISLQFEVTILLNLTTIYNIRLENDNYSRKVPMRLHIAGHYQGCGSSLVFSNSNECMSLGDGAHHERQRGVHQRRHHGATWPGRQTSQHMKHQFQSQSLGFSCRFPGDATSPEKVGKLCVEGRSAWSEIPEDRSNRRAFYHPGSDNHGTVRSAQLFQKPRC